MDTTISPPRLKSPIDAKEMGIKLVHCPFCKKHEQNIIEGKTSLLINFVECRNCKMDGPVCETVALAIKAWNYRP